MEESAGAKERIWGMEICRMQECDLDEVAAIEQETFSEPWSRKSFLETYQKEVNCYLVAKEDGKILAYCGLWTVLDEGDICNVAVRADARRRGIAYEMLARLLSEGEKMGVRAFTLEVRVSNTPAIALYKKLGFQGVGVRPRFYTKPEEDALIMWKIQMEEGNRFI